MATQVLLANGSATSPTVQWSPGLRGSLLIVASAYATTTKLQILASDNTTWLDISANITANGKTDYDLPPGSYRLFLSGGSPSGMYAVLAPLSYNG